VDQVAALDTAMLAWPAREVDPEVEAAFKRFQEKS